ncbi:hypothetical protein PSYPI_21507, partial [Pseudomonas syringae pv. pisi str. 1704B]
IEGVNADSLHFNTHLSRASVRWRRIHDSQYVGATIFVELNGFHIDTS